MKRELELRRLEEALEFAFVDLLATVLGVSSQSSSQSSSTKWANGAMQATSRRRSLLHDLLRRGKVIVIWPAVHYNEWDNALSKQALPFLVGCSSNQPPDQSSFMGKRECEEMNGLLLRVPFGENWRVESSVILAFLYLIPKGMDRRSVLCRLVEASIFCYARQIAIPMLILSNEVPCLLFHSFRSSFPSPYALLWS